MICLGSVPAGTTIYIPFATYAGSTGASVTCTGLAVTDIEIYKDGSVTQRSSDAGYTLLDTDGIDFDGITGLHGFSINLNDNTDTGFFAVGSWYWVVVSAITVDSQTVTFLAATFRICPAESITGYPKIDVHGLKGDAQSATDLQDFADAGYDPATNKVQGVVLVDTVTTLTGHTPQTGDTYALANGSAGFVAIDTVVDAILADTGTDGVVVAAGSKTGYTLTAGTGLGNQTADITGTITTVTTATNLTNLPTIPANWITAAGINASAFTAAKFDTACLTDAKFATGAITATVLADGAITNAKFAAGAIDNAAIATDAIGSAELAATAVAEIADQVWDELLSGHVVSGSAGEALAAATAPSAAAVADAVWDEALAGHLAAGSTGEALNSAGGAGDPWITTLPGAYTGSQAGKILADILVDTGTTLQGELDGIQTDTEDIQARLPAALVGGRIDASVGAMAANTLTASALAADAVTEIQSGLSTLDASGVRTAVGLATANLDTQIGTLATAANLATVAGYLDTEIAAILQDTNELQADWANGGRLDVILDTAAADALKAADRSGYVLALAGGAISNPQTATETFVVTTGGNTFTVTGSGITSTGGRSAPTLAKT